MSILRVLARRLFSVLGWTLVGEIAPHIQRAVIVVAPHTSNWDGFYGLLFCFVRKMNVRFAIKKEALFFPVGFLLKKLGAIPIDRKESNLSTIRHMTAMLQGASSLMLIIAPEGTRGPAPRWKYGFYHIAQKAGVPVVLGHLDYAQKKIGLGPTIYPTGDLEKDLQQIQAFYQDKVGKYPR